MRALHVLAIALLVGCLVPKKKLDAALADKEELQNRVDGQTRAMNEMSAEIQKDRDDIKARQAALDEAERKLASKVQEEGQMQADIEQMKAALSEAEVRKQKAEQQLQQFRDLVAKFQSMIDAGTLKVKVEDGRMVVELATDILFPSGSAALSPAGRDTVKSVATVLASIPDREYQVAGYTDNVPIASFQFPSNWELGAARAISVTRLLIDGGLPALRVSAASYGEYHPVADNGTAEGKAANRRIDIIVVPNLADMPGYDELQKLSQAPSPAAGAPSPAAPTASPAPAKP